MIQCSLVGWECVVEAVAVVVLQGMKPGWRGRGLGRPGFSTG